MVENHLTKLIELALEEDIGDGDITTSSIVPENQNSIGHVIAKQNGVLAGIDVFEKVFKYVDTSISVVRLKNNGDLLKQGDRVVEIEGKTSTILKSERTALNFLGHLSGIATEAGKYAEEIENTKTKILDTRKTKPGMRKLEKMAVKLGGGENHRAGLYDMILIKENHIESAGSIEKAIEKAIEYRKGKRIDVKIEVEIKNLNEVKIVSGFPVDFIMLDNFDLESMKKAVDFIGGRIKLEASGNVSLNNVKKIAQTGVDFISVGAMTHSAKNFDFSLLLKHIKI